MTARDDLIKERITAALEGIYAEREPGRFYQWATHHLPLWLLDPVYPSFCFRHDRAVTRRHGRWCRHRTIIIDEPPQGASA